MKVVLASNNQGKIREFQALLKNVAVDIIPQADLGVSDIPETGLTFVENALIKARHATQMTGLPALADDSGLTVAALNGAPGIYSARYAGEAKTTSANITKLLAELEHVPEQDRHAFFYCVLVFITHENDPTPLICDGKWHGRILTAPRGECGFGYDPVFYVPSKDKASAELPPEVKNKISHRGIAIQSLLTLLPDKINECAVSTKSN
jgi:XTP/dITP diphosphohydrolase